MKQLKRTLLTLVALLAVTTGAWAAGSDALAGVFTINASGDKVQFSKGNLQAVFSAAGTDCTWQFAENQWDCSGYGGGTGGNYLINGNGSVSAPGTVDLFGWSTSATKFGILRSTDNNDFSGDFVDWGVNIGEGWRTLSADEWKYLLDNHTYGFATVCGVKGIFVLPDGCSLTINTAHNNFNNNTIDAAEWASTYAPVGVLFLPAHGFLHGNDYSQHQISAYYWSSTAAATDGQKYAILYAYQESSNRVYNESKIAFNASSCFSVRLVRKPATATPVDLTWSAATPNTASIDKMPAGNVTVSVEYFPQAEFAKSTDETLAPTAIADVPANTDAPIVKAGTVANIGTSEVPQGTLMYYVSQPTGNTFLTAPGYDDDGWTDKVPTADGLAQGKAYVWYYIKGAEPATIAERTDANTRSDSDIMPLGSNGIVTLLPEPTYDVSLNKTGMAEGEPALWKAKSTNVAEVNLGEADLEGVKKSETVTVTYSGDRKVIGVKAEKAKEPVTLATPLTIEAITAGTIQVNTNGTLSTGMKYSVNGGTKTDITSTTTIEGLKAGDKVQFYSNGTGNTAYSNVPEVKISGGTAEVKAYGNIMSLLDEERFATKTDLQNYAFFGLFKENTTLIDASELLLPAATLTASCYQQMFEGCTALTKAPKLPATTLESYCYYGMFQFCTSLTAAPELPAATWLAAGCYAQMFSGCTSLTSAYVKAAYTNVSDECYNMFYGCTATGATLHTTSGNKASWEGVMGTGKTWSNWSVADDWQD